MLQRSAAPVDWWPWSPEAFTETWRRDAPVLFLEAYASRHWCVER
ncbi:DUF255 domain-containing protein [Kitasatospora sp. MAP12-44]